MSDSDSANSSPDPIVLLTGASGYVGGLFLNRLEASGVNVRCLVRNTSDFIKRTNPPTTQVASGDVLVPDSLDTAMQGIKCAYYLIHSMSTSASFEELDRQAAENFGNAAKQAGVERIIYLGGLGDDSDPNLSPHLRSRHEVGRILAEHVPTVELRASAILGAGSLSFELIRSLTNRLPIMLCPKWLSTSTQPIASGDLLDYLIEAKDLPPEMNRVFEIGGSDVVTYGELIQEFATQSGLRRWLISIPVLTPYLSGLWLGLVTPAKAEVGRHLIEGLRNPTVVNDNSALSVFRVEPMGIEQAMSSAIAQIEHST